MKDNFSQFHLIRLSTLAPLSKFLHASAKPQRFRVYYLFSDTFIAFKISIFFLCIFLFLFQLTWLLIEHILMHLHSYFSIWHLAIMNIPFSHFTWAETKLSLFFITNNIRALSALKIFKIFDSAVRPFTIVNFQNSLL